MASDPGTVGNVLAGAIADATSVSEEIAQLAAQLRQLRTASEAATDSLRASSSGATHGSGSSASASSTLLNVFTEGLGLSPVISGLASLFGAGGNNSSSTPLSMPRFALAPSIDAHAGVSERGGQPFAVDSRQGGFPRAVPTPAAAPAQITVQVQAIDSQSFLDRSADIAKAVRQAMLESSVLNDVIREA